MRSSLTKSNLKRDRKLKRNTDKKMEKYTGIDLSISLDQNVKNIKEVFGGTVHLINKRFKLNSDPEKEVAIFYFDDLVNKDYLHHFIIKPLLEKEIENPDELVEEIVEEILVGGEIKQSNQLRDVIDGLLAGDSVILIEGVPNAIIMGTRGWQTRGISEPRTEQVVRGPKEALSDTYLFSLGLIRRRLHDPDMRTVTKTIGRRSKTVVGMLYIHDIADPRIVKEVEKRLDQIDIDAILESNYIQELIQDHPISPFPQVQNTERPDSVCAHLLEGKVAILVDGTPFALICPAVFSQFYNSPEDYYQETIIATFTRMVRLLGLVFALTLPAIYVALLSFHNEMIPFKLAINIAGWRATVPFAPVVEAFLMELTVEVLREASLRLPGPIGPTIGIVGALVIGDAAVSAGLVSPAMVIVVGLTTISSYANPNYNAATAIRLLRFPLIFLGGSFGLFGIVFGILLILIHLTNLRSFGVPYLSPIVPTKPSDWKDTVIRSPWRWMQKRPFTFHTYNIRRQKGGNQ
ncbi:spore germination protein [Risungbinella massiliensis]|uniref:spore germination protein n=1 Tax=Risungbinella massiliensis TaxID=1329796 RepID=UPI0005CC36D0|nr:spore germination protein [Risungbinella massiliensis]